MELPTSECGENGKANEVHGLEKRLKACKAWSTAVELDLLKRTWREWGKECGDISKERASCRKEQVKVSE